MEMNELAMRLDNLERARSEDLQKRAQQAFMDKYGSRISNNESLGLIILNELNRQGVDTSAADEAVQQIIDQLRMEATMLLDTLKENMQAASDLLDKVDTMADAVDTAALATGADMSLPSGGMDAGGMPPVEPMAPMPPEGGEVPPEEGGAAPEGGEMPPAEGEAAPEAAGGEVPPEEGGAVPPEGGATPPEDTEMPPQAAVSDERMKRIQTMKAHRPAKPAKPSGFKLDTGIISACRGL